MKTLITLFAILSLTLIATAQPPDTLWTRTFGGSSIDYGNSVQQTTDGGYIIAGYTYSYGAGSTDVYLIKTDANGNQVWQRTFGGSNYDFDNSVQQTSDGGYIIAGTVDSYFEGSGYVYLIKTDIAGILVWQRTFGMSDWAEGWSVQQTSDGGYIVAGYTDYYGSGYPDVYMIKTDNAGSLVWQRTFGGSDWDESNSVQQTSDGGYVIAGYTGSYGAGSYDVYLIKTDAGWVPPTLDINISAVNPPIIIPANGGSFQYNMNVHNLTTQPQTFSLWNKVRSQSGFYIQIFGPVTRTLPGETYAIRVLTQTVAATIPAGTLDFISYVGTYPSTVQDSSFFTITKLANGDGGPWISESNVTGDVFDEFGLTDEQGVQLNAPTQTGLRVDIKPNPFNPATMLTFSLSHPARVTLEVFDIGGRMVGQPSVAVAAGGRQGRLPHQQWFTAGTHEIPFDGSGLPSGIYLYRLQAGENTACGKMVLLK